MGVGITTLHHVNITVPRSLETGAKHFYSSLLGLVEVPKPEESRGRGGAWYQIGDSQMHLSVEDESEHPSKRHICFTVENLSDAEEHLRTVGVEIIPDERPVKGCARFYVRDPAGNLIEIATHDN